MKSGNIFGPQVQQDRFTENRAQSFIEILHMHKIELRKTAITRLRYGKRTETGMAMYLLHRLTDMSAVQSLL